MNLRKGVNDINFLQKHLFIILAEVFLVVVIIYLLKPKVVSPPPAPEVDSMADHHKSKPADSSVFTSLLGKPAPDFSLTSYDGKIINLKDLRGKNVILFFNEGLMCYPSCWNQIVAFGKDKALLDKNTVVLNITADPKDDWKKAIEKMPELATNTVLLDTQRAVSSQYGVLSLESSMHRGEFPGHTYVLIDKDGIVRFTKDDPQMAVRNQELIAQISK